ncbi:MarR family winged helix-turn-helix transcriptional regulator [Erysipelotrichaceae bacterium 66-17]|uniref:MarR family winged helix-turn-helix transcriptional regulator n=1 Tax=uncultured Dubosiella sp. TaxID=1937011 RepID=UPI0026163362|nr:MarR family winged helix-turn-helix transcriptional regulator [uncultured Dubosiella sp.]
MEPQAAKGTIIEIMIKMFRLVKENMIDGSHIKPRQIAILHHIYSCPHHRETISNLARDYQITDAAASQMVTYFEKQGWVNKVRTEFDRRVVYVEVNKDFMDEMKEKFSDMIDDVNRYLTYLGPKDANALERILNKTIAYMEEKEESV